MIHFSFSEQEALWISFFQLSSSLISFSSSSLKQAITGIDFILLFSFKAVYQLFILISFDRNSVNFMPLHQNNYFQLFSEWWLYYWCFKYIIIISVIYTRILSGSWIRCVWREQENTIRRLNLRLLFSSAPDIRKVCLGRKVGVTISRH